MKTAELDRLKQRLLELQGQLETESDSRMESLQEVLHPAGELTNVPTHAADRDVEGIDSELAVARVEDSLREKVAAALKRIHSGEYGRCERCGEAIPAQRLSAVPETPFCIQCELEVEHEDEQ